MPVAKKYISIELCCKMRKINYIFIRQKKRKVLEVNDILLSRQQNLTKMIGFHTRWPLLFQNPCFLKYSTIRGRTFVEGLKLRLDYSSTFMTVN